MNARRPTQRTAVLAAVAVCAVFVLLAVVWLARDREPSVARATSESPSSAIAAVPEAARAMVDEVEAATRDERRAVAPRNQPVAMLPSKIIRTSDCVIRGRVFTNDREQPPIGVELFALAGGIPDRASVDSANVDRNGDFVLRPETFGEFAVLAFADDHEPVTLRTKFEPHSEVVLAPITLERGAAIYGEVRKLGQRVGAGVKVRAKLLVDQPDDARRYAAGTNWLWSNGRFDWAAREVATDASAQFAVRGLAASRYSLSVSNLDQATLELADIERVTASASDVVLDIGTCTVNLHFVRGDTAVRAARFRVRPLVEHVAGEYVWLQADGDGNAKLNVMPNSRFELCMSVARWTYDSSIAVVGDGNAREFVSGPVGSEIDLRIDVPAVDSASSERLILER
jgi:hypothetical protein